MSNPTSCPDPSKSLVTGCVVCGRKNGLSCCSACNVIPYCGREHQASHRQAHKSVCNKIKRAKAQFEIEEAKLRAHPGDFMTPANPLEDEDAIGRFWGLVDTRDYMRARYAYVESVIKAKSRRAIETAVRHLEDMFRLCRGDNMGLRDIAPHLYLRLGRDQECYGTQPSPDEAYLIPIVLYSILNCIS